MSDKTYKIIEVVGVSDDSIQEAVRNAVTKASQTLRNIDWFEVGQIRGAVRNGKPEFQVDVRIGFRLEGAPVT
jgi:flavin-binding protein dodecin